MDLQMPEVDGYKATRIIREGINRSIPIIAMTADALKGEAEKCFEAGMNGYISKPFEPKELYHEILRLIKRKRSVPQKSNIMQPDLIDFTYLYELSGNDPDYINEVLNLFLGTMPEGLEQLEHLVRNTEDWTAINKQAHFLKSSVSVVHIRDMFQYLTEIENSAKEKDKAAILPVLDKLLNTYHAAHPLLIAEKERHPSRKI